MLEVWEIGKLGGRNMLLIDKSGYVINGDYYVTKNNTRDKLSIVGRGEVIEARCLGEVKNDDSHYNEILSAFQ